MSEAAIKKFFIAVSDEELDALLRFRKTHRAKVSKKERKMKTLKDYLDDPEGIADAERIMRGEETPEERAEINAAIERGLADVAAGRTVPAKQAFDEMREKYFETKTRKCRNIS
jgi:hypothetical protein